MDSTLIIGLTVLVFSVVLHELGHGYAALKLGDPTAQRLGRLSLNPISHIDLFHTIILPFVLFYSCGVALGGAKPVPVNPHQFTHASPRRGMMLVAAAGPAVNFVLAGIGIILLHVLPRSLPPVLFQFSFALTYINAILGLFNLLPIPPLDGSRVVAGLLPREQAATYMSIERYGLFILLGVVLTGIHVPLLNAGLQFLNLFLPTN